MEFTIDAVNLMEYNVNIPETEVERMTKAVTEDERALLGRILGAIAAADAESLRLIAAFADGVRARAEIEARGADQLEAKE